MKKKMSTIAIAKKQIQAENGVVILPLKEYQRLLKNAVPTFYLSGKEASDLDRLAKKTLCDYKNGKTKKISSLRDLM
jgi:hypothetical protein